MNTSTDSLIVTDQQIFEEIIKKVPHNAPKRCIAHLRAFPDPLLRRIIDTINDGVPRRTQFVGRAISDQRGEKFIENLITYKDSLSISASHKCNEWMLEALNAYQEYSWYPDTLSISSMPAVSRHLKETSRVVSGILSYWYEHPEATHEGLTHHRKTKENHIWLLADETLTRHLYEYPEDADLCKETISERGTVNYEMLVSLTENAVSAGWL